MDDKEKIPSTTVLTTTAPHEKTAPPEPSAAAEESPPNFWAEVQRGVYRRVGRRGFLQGVATYLARYLRGGPLKTGPLVSCILRMDGRPSSVLSAMEI
jgi:hypothetical protein